MRLDEISAKEEWIIDGNYLHSLPMRLNRCDTVFFFDLPLAVCLAGAEERIGNERKDMSWIENQMDPEFRQWIIDFPKQQLPIIRKLLMKYNHKVNVVVFHSRKDADIFIDSI